MNIQHIFEDTEIFEKLTTGERLIFEYLSKNWRNSNKMKVQIVADECYCSTTSVQRLIRKLGFSSFSEFKVLCQNDNKLEIIHKEFTEIDEILNKIDINSIDGIVNEILKNEHIYVYGVGASSMTGMFLMRQLMILGIHASHIEDIHSLKNINKGLFIAISSSGTTRLIINSVLRAKNNGLTIASITAKNSLLDKMSHTSYLHTIKIREMDYIQREMQLHLFIMISQIINGVYKSKS